MGTLKQAVDRVTAAKTAIGNAITAKGGTVAAGDGLEDFAADIGTITNQYTAGDEGKVVSNGALVAQTAYPSTITENGTYNTTENNSIVVSVPSLPTGIEIAKLTAVSSTISNDNMYIVNTEYRTLVIGRAVLGSGANYHTFSYPSTFTPRYTQGYNNDIFMCSKITTGTQVVNYSIPNSRPYFNLSNHEVNVVGVTYWETNLGFYVYMFCNQ